jgi:hypothetical protein
MVSHDHNLGCVACPCASLKTNSPHLLDDRLATNIQRVGRHICSICPLYRCFSQNDVDHAMNDKLIRLTSSASMDESVLHELMGQFFQYMGTRRMNVNVQYLTDQQITLNGTFSTKHIYK